jgi:RimJ/RimL family protein N-acetyltransferase
MIRLARATDSAALHQLQCRLDAQSEWMLLSPGERDPTDDKLKRRLADQDGSGSFDLVADDSENGSVFSGWLSITVLPYQRVQHVGYLVVGVDATSSRRGHGHGLLAASIVECGRRAIRRLELTVMTDNHRALDLYLRNGFKVEGLRRDAILRGDRWVDEYYMSLLLRPEDHRSD